MKSIDIVIEQILALRKIANGNYLERSDAARAELREWMSLLYSPVVEIPIGDTNATP